MSWNNKEEIRSKYFPETFSVSNICYWTFTFLPRSKKSPPSSAEVENEWSYTSTPLICLHGTVKDLFSFRVKHGAVSGKFSGTASLAPLYHCNVGGITSFVQINQPTRCNNFSSLLLDVYVQFNMFRASSRPSSGAQHLQ